MLKRELYLEKIRPFYDSDLIKIIVGIRRAGKSVILKQIIEELKDKKIDEKHILYLNFERIEYEELSDYKKLNSYIQNKIIDDKKYYIFFDEIGYVKNFEKAVNSMRASFNVSLFITGSNSKLLASELSTVLSGRYVSFKVKPLSYKEATLLTNNKSDDKNFLADYIKWGSLPNRFEFADQNAIAIYLNDVFDSIVLRDIIERLNIKDVSLFNLIFKYIVDTVGREFSAKNIITYLKNEKREISNTTLYSYLEALCKSFLIQKVERYDVHGKAILKTLSKYYLTDLGLAEIKRNKASTNLSYALENIVYNELLIKGYNVFVGKTRYGEIDFVAMKKDDLKYIQVALTVKEENTYQRELDAFANINDDYPKILITTDEFDYSKDGVVHLNLFDFLSNDKF